MISACDNPLYCLSPSGYVGRRLAAHETTWLQHVLERNPNLFEAFAHPDDNRLHKSQWHGEYPGKLLTGMAQCYRMRRDPRHAGSGRRAGPALSGGAGGGRISGPLVP